MKKFLSSVLASMFMFSPFSVSAAQPNISNERTEEIIKIALNQEENIVEHDISNVIVPRYDAKGNFTNGILGSSENINIKKPENSTYEQDLFIFNWMLGNLGRKFNLYGQLTFEGLMDEGISSSQVGFQIDKTEDNKPIIYCWDWDDQGGTTYRERILHMNAAMEVFKYYAKNPEEGKAIWAYIDNAVKTHTEICDVNTIHKFGETKVKFIDPGHWGVNVEFVDVNYAINPDTEYNEEALPDANDWDEVDAYLKRKFAYLEGKKRQKLKEYDIHTKESTYNMISSQRGENEVALFQNYPYFEDGLICVKIDGNYGVINKNGEWVIEPIYDSAIDFDGNKYKYACVNKDGKYGALKPDGTWLIEPKFDEDFNIYDSGSMNVVYNGKSGVLNVEGEWIIEPVFDYSLYFNAMSFSDGLLPVKSEGKYGYMNKEYKFVIEPKFKLAWSFEDGLAIVILEDKYGYINKEGKFTIEPKFAYAASFQDGLACVKLEDKYGFINKEGEFTIDPKFDVAESFQDGIARVKIEDKYGLVNKEGKFIVEPKFDQVTSFQYGPAIVELEDKYGLINKKGEFIVEPKFDNAMFWKQELILVKLEDKYEFINKDGISLTEAELELINPDYRKSLESYNKSNKKTNKKIKKKYKGGLKPSQLNGKYGYTNTNEEFIIKPQFDYAFEFLGDLAMVRLNGKIGFINGKGEFVVTPQFERASQFEEESAWVQLNGKYGYIDEKGNFLIEPKFSDAFNFNDGIACVQLDDKYGFIDKKGNFIVEPKFEWFSNFTNEYVCVQLNGRLGLVNRKGETIVPGSQLRPIHASNFSEKFLNVTLDDSEKIINKEGEPKFDIEFDKTEKTYEGYIRFELDEQYGLMDEECNFLFVKHEK